MTGEKRHRDSPETEDVVARTQKLSQKTNLSDREAEFLAWKELGYTHEEIAEKMDVQKGTIDSYAHRVKTKYERAAQTVSEVRDQFDSHGTEEQGIDLPREDSSRFQKGDQVAYFAGKSDIPYVRTDIIGEVVAIRDDDTPRKLVIRVDPDILMDPDIRTDTDNIVTLPESGVIGAWNGKGSAPYH